MRRNRIVVFAMFMMIVFSACGQKPGVHVAQGFSNGGVNGGGGTDGTGTGGTGGIGTGGTGTTGTGGTGGTGGTVGTGNNGGGGGGGGGSGAGDTTGVTPNQIIIGIHAPVTGAAPIKASSFNYGKDLFWNWLSKVKHDSVFGRQVKVLFADDGYTPQGARQVCDNMATNGHAFLLIGAAGTDQIASCASYANSRGIPYLSAGVTKTYTNFGTYFGVTMTYPDQMPLLVQYIKKLGASEDRYGPGGVAAADGKITIGMVAPDTQNFADARAALSQAVNRAGSPYVFKLYLVSKDEAPQDAGAVMNKIKADGVDIISPITAPVFTIALATNSGGQQYFPRYAGVGVTNAINQAIGNECQQNQFGGGGHPAAMFFSPWAGWSQRAQYGGKDYDDAVAVTPGASKINTMHDGGDLMWSLWGIMKTVYYMFKAVGPNLTRQNFINTIRTYSTKGQFKDFPNVAYSASNRWGATQVHALTGDCANQEWVEDDKNPGLHSNY